MSLPLTLVRRVRLAALTTQSARSYAAYWNKDWMPGPAPKNEDERRAAARKYGLVPEDYEPYPDDGTGYGDYPKLPIVSAESRDQHYNFDYDELKRNHGEPLHVECDMYGEDRLNENQRLPVPLWQMVASFLTVMSTAWLLALGGQYIRVSGAKKMPKQLPKPGETHYTFETE